MTSTRSIKAVRALFSAALFGVAVLSGVVQSAMAQSAPAAPASPSTQPSASPAPGSAGGGGGGADADRLLQQMLRDDPAARPLRQVQFTRPLVDATSGAAAVTPGAPTMPLLREGTFIVDRTGRLTRAADNTPEFRFDSDGRTLRDPPLVILANSKLMQMEEELRTSNRDLRFRVTGIVTEYRGRNGILLEKVVVIPDVIQQN